MQTSQSSLKSGSPQNTQKTLLNYPTTKYTDKTDHHTPNQEAELLIAVYKNIPTKERSATSNIEVLTIKIKNTSKLKVEAVYYPPQVKINLSDLDAIVLPQGPGLYIIDGDFNAKHILTTPKETKMAPSSKIIPSYTIIKSSIAPLTPIRNQTAPPLTSTFSHQMSLSHKAATP